jgi:hypothetical protein
VTVSGTRLRGSRALDAALPPWVVARLLVVLSFALAVAVDREPEPVPLRQGLWSWDGAFYRDIAVGGYHAVPLAGLRFFPLYPLIGRLGATPFGHAGFVLLVIANISALGAGVLLYQLAVLEKGDRRLAGRASWLLALVPPAFVLVFAYAEALYLLLAVGFFLALRKRSWWWAAGLGALAGLTRPHGLFLAVPALIEAARGLRGVRVAALVPRSAAVAGPVIGVGVFLVWARDAFGDGLLPLSVQGDFRGDVVDPVTRLVQGVGDLFGSETFGDGLHLPFALVVLALAIATFRYWPASYGVYALLVVVAALSADNLNSLERYGLNAFPIVLTLACLTASERVERIALAICGSGFVALASLALLGVYVP